MDEQRFDQIVRLFAFASSRRHLIGAAFGAIVGAARLAEGLAQARPCPSDKKRCGKRCIPKRRCCTSGECRSRIPGSVCRRGKCQCPAGRKKCQDRCIPKAACCAACPGEQKCRSGICCFPTAAALRQALGPGGPAVMRLCPNTVYRTDASGPFTINRNLTLLGAAGAVLERGQGPGLLGVLNVGSGAGVTELRDVIIRNGIAVRGGGISNEGGLTLTRCIVTGNRASVGGGIANRNRATLTLVGSRVTANSASEIGSGVYNDDSLLILRNGSRVDGNNFNVVVEGGGIFNEGGTVVLEDTSSVTNNQASGDGGGIFSQDGRVHLTGASRVTLNSASQGGGIFRAGLGEVIFSGSSCVGSNQPDDCVPESICTGNICPP